MMRTKGEAGTGDIVQAVRHMRMINSGIRRIASLREDELYEAAKELGVCVQLLRYVHANGRLPVVNFSAGGVATPADAALMMELGAEGVFVGCDPPCLAKGIHLCLIVCKRGADRAVDAEGTEHIRKATDKGGALVSCGGF